MVKWDKKQTNKQKTQIKKQKKATHPYNPSRDAAYKDGVPSLAKTSPAKGEGRVSLKPDQLPDAA